MFATWSNALVAILVVIGTNRLVAAANVGKGDASILLQLWRGGEPKEPPSHADDQWDNSVGQRRYDARRGRRAAQAVILGIVVAQLFTNRDRRRSCFKMGRYPPPKSLRVKGEEWPIRK